MPQERWYAEDCVRWLRWELRGLLAGSRLRLDEPLSAAGVQRWQVEAAVGRLLDRCGDSLALREDTLLTTELSLEAVVAHLQPIAATEALPALAAPARAERCSS